jgi:hypothetical protein
MACFFLCFGLVPTLSRSRSRWSALSTHRVPERVAHTAAYTSVWGPCGDDALNIAYWNAFGDVLTLAATAPNTPPRMRNHAAMIAGQRRRSESSQELPHGPGTIAGIKMGRCGLPHLHFAPPLLLKSTSEEKTSAESGRRRLEGDVVVGDFGGAFLRLFLVRRGGGS